MAVDYFMPAVTYLLEDEGGLYEDKETGEISNFGISFKWLKTVNPRSTEQSVRKMTRAVAIDLYRTYWWVKYKFDLLRDCAVATKLFTHAVNMGPETAITIFQQTINEPMVGSSHNDRIPEDGMLGPVTARAAAEECALRDGRRDLLRAFVFNLVTHYHGIVAHDPRQAKNLGGWVKRAERLPVI